MTEMTQPTTSINYTNAILEEVALEGLDGITIKTLCLRLMLRNTFPLPIDEYTLDYIWECIKGLRDVEFFCLPNERDEFLTDGFKLETENLEERLAIFETECYPVSVPNDSDCWGSCFTLMDRVNVSLQARGMTLQQVQQTWGSKFVMVASLQLRFKFLSSELSSRDIHEAFHNKLSYACLEKIGRSRDRGITGTGPNSLASVDKDYKRCFYFIQGLQKKHLVGKSLCDTFERKRGVSCKFYLSRFSSAFNTGTLLDRVVNELKTVPNGILPLDELTIRFPQLLDKTVRKKLITSDVPRNSYRVCYKNVSADELGLNYEDNSPAKKKGKRIKCVQLLEPVEEMDELDEEDLPLTFSVKREFIPDCPLTYRVYQAIMESGSKGMSLKEIFNKLAVDMFMVRVVVNNLQKKRIIRSFTTQSQRQLVRRFVLSEEELRKPVVQTLLDKMTDELHDTKTAMSPEKQNSEKLIVSPVAQVAAIDDAIASQIEQLIDANTSARRILRLGIVIRALKMNGVMAKYELLKLVLTEEANLGYSDKLDRRSLQRILDHLVAKSVIKSLPNENKEDKNRYYSTMTYQPDGTNYEMSLYNDPKNPHYKLVVKSDQDVFTFFGSNSVPRGQNLKLNEKYAPKYLRLSILHDLIFYLTRAYTGITDRSTDELSTALQGEVTLDEDILKEMPTLFSDHITCYMFIPPLSSTHDAVRGWCTLTDLLINCPLSVYLKLVKVGALPPTILEYATHPIRSNYPLRFLPLSMRSQLLTARQVTQAHHDIKRLCFMGLTRFGERAKPKMHLELIYVNTRASILDTTTSPQRPFQIDPSVTYKMIQFQFQSILDVKEYWVKLFNVCLETQLCGRADEDSVVREHLKVELKPCLAPCPYFEAAEADNGKLPGDMLGAGGIDSVLYSFVRSNWVSKSAEKVKPVRKTDKAVKPKEEEVVQIPPVADTDDEVHKVEKDAPKRKRNLDDLDLQAIKEMKSLRVHWLASEDSILLLCRAAMSYLCPNSRKSARITAGDVRTALRRYSPESNDKTQKSIARRILFLLKKEKKESTVACVVQVLRGCSQVNKKFDATDLVNQIKPTAPNCKELMKKLSEKFHSLMEYMVTRFLDKGVIFTSLEVDLPDTIEELYEKFECEERPPQRLTIRKIREDAIRSVIMSSLASVTDKCSVAAQLFEVYRQFDDHLLHVAMRRLKNQKVVALQKRNFSHLPSRTKYIPMGNAPYQFSRGFCFLMNTKYLQCVYHDAYVELNRILCIKSGEKIELNLSICGPAVFVLCSLGLVKLTAATPEQFVVLDSHMLPKDAPRKIMKRYSAMVKGSGRNDASMESGDNDQKQESDDVDYEPTSKRPFLFTEPDDDDDGTTQNITMEKRAEARVARALKRKYEDTKLSFNNEEPDDDDAWDKIPLADDDVSIEEQGMDIGFRSARLALYTLREVATKELEGISNLNRKTSVDLFVVSTSKIICSPNGSLKKTYGVSDGRSVRKLITKITNRADVLRIVDEETALSNIRKTLSPRMSDELCSVHQYVSSRGALGAHVTDLVSNCRYDDLASHLRLLVEESLVLKLGINETRYVSSKNAVDWAINSLKLTKLNREKINPTDLSLPRAEGSEKARTHPISSKICEVSQRIRLIMRPWIRIEGTLNRKVLDRFLGTILGYIMMCPGCTISNVVNKFAPSLTAVWIKEIIDILEEIGCVKRRLVHVTKATLFNVGTCNVSDEVNGMEPDDKVILDPKIDAVIKLGQFIGNKSYTKDVLSV